MPSSRIALAIICKGSDEEAKLLDRCLKNMSPYVDGIFITRTQLPTEKPNEAVAKVARKYKAKLSDFIWVYDFAAARNFNFNQVPADFTHILWTDADDIWRGLEKLKPTIEDNDAIDAFGFIYLYDWDEFKKPTVVHRKTMLVKNDGCVTWKGALHEDLSENRQLEVKLIDGIERLHLTDSDRAARAAERNVLVAEKDNENNPDDPRTLWNLANSYFGAAKYELARDAFEQFLADSESDEEKYLAYTRLADVHKSLGAPDQAITQLRIAIGMNASSPEAYFQLAHLYFNMSSYEKAEEYCLRGMKLRPNVNKMIVFNPRDYDYNPMMLLAKVYYQTNRPDLMLPLLKGCLKIYPEDKHLQRLVKEGQAEYDAMEKALQEVKKLQELTDKDELRKALDTLPPEIKSHPAVAVIRNQHFIKEESSGRDLVIYCGMTNHEWNPVLFKERGFGGSEEAVIHLAREFANLGWNVTVYNNCGYKPVREIIGNKQIIYRPFWEFNYRDKQDVMILWRWAKPLDFAINAAKIFVDLHDVVPEGEFTPKRLEKVSKIFVKTEFHRSLFPNVPDSKIAVIPNGMESYLDPSIKKDPYLIINTSSPDRSMDVLPKLFKRVKERVPEARMQWAYGWDVYEASNANNQKLMQWMRDTQKDIDDSGIETLGRLTQAEVGKLYQRAAIFAYPTEFAEIDCISVKKAQAARALPITTDFGALKESNVFGLKVHSEKDKDTWARPYQFHFGLESEEAQDEWVEIVVEHLQHQYQPNWRGLDEWRQSFLWSAIAKRWHDILCA